MIIGLDVGGTHSDAALLSSKGLIAEAKELTDHNDLVSTLVKAIDKLLLSVKAEEVTRVVLSTTLVTNAVVRKTLEPAALLVSSGPGLDPVLYKLGSSYHVIKGAIDHRGEEILPIDKKEVEKAFKDIANKGIRSLALVSKFSVRNPSHENTMAEMAKGSFDSVFCGHQISGVLNFPRRLASSWLNASVYRLYADFRSAILKAFEARGIKAPVYVLKADGGTFSLDAALECPGETVLSGPSASLMGAMPYAEDKKDSLVLDIGGTTTDIALLIDKVPVLERFGASLGGIKTLFRSLKSVSIGLGGDSELWLKEGELSIGPDRKGPALCMGGPSPTPTDALVVLGLYDVENKEASFKGIEELGLALSLSVDQCAGFVIERFTQKIWEAALDMLAEINSRPVYTIHEMLEGYKAEAKALLLMGGPARALASSFEKVSGLKAVLVPNFKIANAVGAAIARTTSSLNLIADTQKGFLRVPEEGYHQEISSSFSLDDAVELAKQLLFKRALALGADKRGLEIEILEAREFAMMRGYRRAGKNIRVRAQVQPGLIHDKGGLIK